MFFSDAIAFLLLYNCHQSNVFHDSAIIFLISSNFFCPCRESGLYFVEFVHQIAQTIHFVSFLPRLVSKKISACLLRVLLSRNF
jgi:hypothetical protein